jgi:hypothetical protein
MQGRAYLDLARELMAGASPVHWRGAIGRAYYALVLEGREALSRWGLPLPPRENVHTWVRFRFTFPADAGLQSIGRALDRWCRMRNKADYDMSDLPAFASPTLAQQAIQQVTVALALLDAIDGDPARRSAAQAAIRAAFP